MLPGSIQFASGNTNISQTQLKKGQWRENVVLSSIIDAINPSSENAIALAKCYQPCLTKNQFIEGSRPFIDFIKMNYLETFT